MRSCTRIWQSRSLPFHQSIRESLMKTRKIAVSLFAIGMMASPLAQATNGYFSHGYCMKAKGMGGAATATATATASDTMGGANNPASMVWVGNRLDVGIDWF